MPSDSAVTPLPRSLEPPRRRQPPPPPSAGLAGPPSIGLDDLERHGEVTLSVDESPALELDFSGDLGAADHEPPEPIGFPGDSGLDLPSPVDISPGDSGLDLPSPVVQRGAPGPHEDSNAFSLDLPAPIEPHAPSSGGAGFGAGFGAPADLDLPVPAGARGAGAGHGASPQPDDRLDLPIPADLPAPGGQELQPLELGLEPAGQELRPTDMGLQPTDMSLQPREGTELAPSALPEPRLRGAGDGAAADPSSPTGESAADAAAPAKKGAAASSKSAGASPAAQARPAVSRGVLYLGGGLLLVGLAGVGVLYSGILDPSDPEPTVTRGGVKKKVDDGGETKVPAGTVAERSPAVLAIMAQHTPAAYFEAKKAATEAGDVVGAAEAALLLHVHYGPNPTLANEAVTALQPHAADEAEHVRRVLGLVALGAGNLAAAESSLQGEGPRTQLYRGWLRLAQGKADEAAAAAKAVLAATPDQVAARHLGLLAQAQTDPDAALAAAQSAVERNAQHVGLQSALADAALAAGALAVARTAVDAIDPEAFDDPGLQAWAKMQRARVHAAQGDRLRALSIIDEARALVPDQPSIETERIHVLLDAKRYNDASVAASTLVRTRADDPEAQLLQARVAVLSGDGDIALQVLERLAAARPQEQLARVVHWKAEVHAMRFEVEEAQAAFAQARELDPTAIRSVIGEANLLLDAKRLPEAITMLDAARSQAEADGRAGDVVRLWVTQASLQSEAGERDAALTSLASALEADPDHNEAQLRRGVLRLADPTPEVRAEGRADLVAVFERTGGYPGLAAPLGRIYVAENDFEALERLIGDRLRGEQTDDELLDVGARLRLHQGRNADARELVEIALVRHPADWEAHMLLAQILIAEGKPVEALAEIERSRPATPQPELMLQRGKILEFNGKHGDAWPEYRKALTRDPALHEARFLYGRSLVFQGANGKALTELRQVADTPEAKGAVWYPEVWMYIGNALQAMGKHAEAIEALREATKLDPRLGEAWAWEGRFHEDRNKHAEAITALEKAVELGTEADHWYADALLNLGKARSKAGKKTAGEALEKFLQVAPAEHPGRAEAERLLGG